MTYEALVSLQAGAAAPSNPALQAGTSRGGGTHLPFSRAVPRRESSVTQKTKWVRGTAELRGPESHHHTL